MYIIRKRVASVIATIALLLFCMSCGTHSYIEAKSTTPNIPSAMCSWSNHTTPSTGILNIPIFMIDFPDTKYGEYVISGIDLESKMFSNEVSGSVTKFYNLASYNQLQVTGHVYLYTAQKNISEYETEEGYEELAMEVINAFDDMIDFSTCDSDEDGVIDSFVLCIPTGGDEEFWYGSQHTWYLNTDFYVDGVTPNYYIMCDSQPDSRNLEYFYQTVCHELGHCMGLPDYYKYNNSEDWEGLKGVAGNEMMDDMQGDFSQFSKLQLGWLKEEDVQIYHIGESKSFDLPNTDKGGCVIIFPTEDEDYQSEYFIIEYNKSKDSIFSFLNNDAGVRIIHAQASVITGYWGEEYKYNNFSPDYDNTDEGIRVIRLVNDGNGYFKAGDEAKYGDEGFNWYNYKPTETLRININDIDDEFAYISISS